MAEITITDQERSLLTLIAKGESSAGVDPYTSLWPGTSEPSLVQKYKDFSNNDQIQDIGQPLAVDISLLKKL